MSHTASKLEPRPYHSRVAGNSRHFIVDKQKTVKLYPCNQLPLNLHEEPYGYAQNIEKSSNSHDNAYQKELQYVVFGEKPTFTLIEPNADLKDVKTWKNTI